MPDFKGRGVIKMGDGKPECSRDKYWDEMCDAERVQRLQHEVLYLRWFLRRLETKVSKFPDHQHVPASGEVMVPLRVSYEQEAVSGPDYTLEHGPK